MYAAGITSIGASFVSWIASNKYEAAGLERADRWGIFVGEWAPTFFAMGIALHLEEMKEEDAAPVPEYRTEREPDMTGRTSRSTSMH
jgi:hypothetical protein